MVLVHNVGTELMKWPFMVPGGTNPRAGFAEFKRVK